MPISGLTNYIELRVPAEAGITGDCTHHRHTPIPTPSRPGTPADFTPFLFQTQTEPCKRAM